VGGEKPRQKSLRIGVHHANAVVWGPVYRTRLDPVEVDAQVVHAAEEIEPRRPQRPPEVSASKHDDDPEPSARRRAREHDEVVRDARERVHHAHDRRVVAQAVRLRVVPYEQMSGWSS
jgi:hypothetical protein